MAFIIIIIFHFSVSLSFSFLFLHLVFYSFSYVDNFPPVCLYPRKVAAGFPRCDVNARAVFLANGDLFIYPSIYAFVGFFFIIMFSFRFLSHSSFIVLSFVFLYFLFVSSLTRHLLVSFFSHISFSFPLSLVWSIFFSFSRALHFFYLHPISLGAVKDA